MSRLQSHWLSPIELGLLQQEEYARTQRQEDTFAAISEEEEKHIDQMRGMRGAQILADRIAQECFDIWNTFLGLRPEEVISPKTAELWAKGRALQDLYRRLSAPREIEVTEETADA